MKHTPYTQTILSGEKFIVQPDAKLDEHGKLLFGAWARGESLPDGYSAVFLATYDKDFPHFQKMAWTLRLAEGSENFPQPTRQEIAKALAFAAQNGIDVGDRVYAQGRDED